MAGRGWWGVVRGGEVFGESDEIGNHPGSLDVTPAVSVPYLRPLPASPSTAISANTDRPRS